MTPDAHIPHAARPTGHGPQEFSPRGRVGLVGIGAVVGIHVLVGYALLSGLARDVVQPVQRPLMASIAPEPVPPSSPPPPPPPRKDRVVERARPSQPPLPHVPAPDTSVPAGAPVPPVAAVPGAVPAPPAPAEIPAPQPVTQAVPGPLPPAPAGRAEAGVACPGYRQSLQSSLAGVYDRIGITGIVKVEFRVRGGSVADVTTVSGPREYYRAVQSAVRRFQCQAAGTEDALVMLDIHFQPE